MKAVVRVLAIFAATAGALLLIKWAGEAYGFRSFFFAFLLNWLAMTWMVVTGWFVPVSMSRDYYRIRPFEKDGSFYERLGIRAFKKLVSRGPLSFFSPTLRYSGARSSIAALEDEMKKAEAGHLVVFCLVILFSGAALLRLWLDAAVWVLVWNLVLNGYPVLLQRYNRARLERVAGRRAERLVGAQPASGEA